MHLFVEYTVKRNFSKLSIKQSLLEYVLHEKH